MKKIPDVNLVRTSLFIDEELRKQLKGLAYKLSDPNQIPVSMAEVMRRILTNAMQMENANEHRK